MPYGSNFGRVSIIIMHITLVSSHDGYHPLTCKKYFASKIHGGLKLFISKIFSNTLPTRSPLNNSIHVNEDLALYPICSREEEITMYPFLNCPLSRILWKESSWIFKYLIKYCGASFLDKGLGEDPRCQECHPIGQYSRCGHVRCIIFQMEVHM